MTDSGAVNLNCYLCGSSDSDVVFTELGVDLRRCLRCRHVFSSWSQPDDYDGYWDDGVTDADVDFWDDAHRSVFEQFSDRYLTAECGRLVDVGCGLGFFVATVARRRPGWQVDGYELAPGAVAYAHDHGLESRVHLGRVEDGEIEPGSLDVVTLWDVIEHLPHPQPLLRYLREQLSPTGFVFLQTPNWTFQHARARIGRRLARPGRPERDVLFAKDHVNQFSRDSLDRLARDCGFAPPVYDVLPPVQSVNGVRSPAAVVVKQSLYLATRAAWQVSGGRVLANPTLFAVLRPATSGGVDR